MRETEREEVIAQRFEELERIADRRKIDQMLKAQKDGVRDRVAKAAEHASPSNLLVPRKGSRREYTLPQGLPQIWHDTFVRRDLAVVARGAKTRDR